MKEKQRKKIVYNENIWVNNDDDDDDDERKEKKN